MSLLGGVIGSLASTMFQSLGINRFEGMAKAELILTPLGPTGAPLTLSGVKNFRLQYNRLDDSFHPQFGAYTTYNQ